MLETGSHWSDTTATPIQSDADLNRVISPGAETPLSAFQSLEPAI